MPLMTHQVFTRHGFRPRRSGKESVGKGCCSPAMWTVSTSTGTAIAMRERGESEEGEDSATHKKASSHEALLLYRRALLSDLRPSYSSEHTRVRLCDAAPLRRPAACSW